MWELVPTFLRTSQLMSPMSEARRCGTNEEVRLTTQPSERKSVGAHRSGRTQDEPQQPGQPGASVAVWTDGQPQGQPEAGAEDQARAPEVPGLVVGRPARSNG